MNEVRRVTPGITRRIFSMERKNRSAPPPRFMRFSTVAEACCRGTSMYEQILSWAAMVASSRPGNLVGISVEEANPLQAFDARELFQQQGQAIFQAKVFAEAGGVLSDERDFAHAGLGQPLGFRDDGFETPRAKLSAKLGNDAEAAGMIAAFGDFDIGRGSRRGQHAGRVVVVKVVGQIGDGAVPGIAREAALPAAMIALGPRGE